jgi:hypothetical protein
MVKILKSSKVLRPKKERDWLMACALMGTHKTIRAMRSLGLTFPQLEFLARRIAKVRVVFLDNAQQLKLPKGSRRPPVKGAFYSGRLVTSLDEKRMNEVEGLAWINEVLPWAYDPLGLSVYHQSKQWPNVSKANTFEAEFISGMILSPLEARLSGERKQKVKKSDKGRRAATDWIMNASMFEILSDDKANEYRWKKLRHIKALSVCSHLAWQVSAGLRKSFPRRYSADVMKCLESNDLKRLALILETSAQIARAQVERFKHELGCLENDLREVHALMKSKNARVKSLKKFIGHASLVSGKIGKK